MTLIHYTIISLLSEKCFLNAVNNFRMKKHIGNNCLIHGWNDLLKDVHAAARDAYLLWEHSGKLRQGVIYDLMRQTRSKFKYAITVCKGNRNSIISDKIAEDMCAKNDRAFWKGSDNISGMWHADLYSNHSLFDQNMVDTSHEMEYIIKDLSYNKSPRLDGICSEHIKFAGQQLSVLLSIIMLAILVHGYVPKSMLKSVIIPTIKQ